MASRDIAALNKLDLNLLVSLHILLEERSVSRAARRLELSQPALSAALAKLRVIFGDDLLVRVGNRYELSPFAARLLPRIAAALNVVRQVFVGDQEFNPTQDEHEFILVVCDYVATMLVPILLQTLSEIAPRVRLRLHCLGPLFSSHEEANLNLVHGTLQLGVRTGLANLPISLERWVCIADSHNPELGETLTVADLGRLPWVAVGSDKDKLAGIELLRAEGVEPEIRVLTDSYNAVPFLVAGSSRLALMPARLAHRLCHVAEVRVLECPFPMPPLEVGLSWHPHFERDPVQIWFRGIVAEAGRRLESGQHLTFPDYPATRGEAVSAW
jgi:DNA-binding transcriptional LysR family regulator